MQSVISVKNLGKRFRLGKRASFASAWGSLWHAPINHSELWALRNLSFDLQAGQILGVIGPNGAGKSTLLKILSRITSPTEGEAHGRGRVLSLLEVGSAFRSDLSGRENIFLNAAMCDISRQEVLRKLDDIVDFAGVEKFLDAPVRTYSSGMYLRLAFSVAINLQPDILLADEVLAVGDLAFQQRCLERVGQASTAGMAVMFVSHDLATVLKLCSQTLWLDQGQMRGLGPTSDITNSYQESFYESVQPVSTKATRSARAPWGVLRSIQLVDDAGSQIGAVDYRDGASVSIAVEVQEAPITLRCSIQLNCLGTPVFRSVQRSTFTAKTAGLYRFSVKLPSNLLAETVYNVDLGVNDNDNKKANRPIVSYNALTFRVYDPVESESHRGSFSGSLKGVVAPLLEWSAEPIT